MGEWTDRAIREASSTWGQPVITTEAPARDLEPIVQVRTWSCADGAIIARSRPDGDFDLSATCQHRSHHEMGQYPLLKVTDVTIIDPRGEPVQPLALPTDAKGYRLRCTVGPIVLQYAPTLRLEIMPLPGGDIADILIGPYAAGETYDVDLYGVVPGERELSIHAVDPTTARRDWAADGIQIWKRTIPTR